MGRSPTFEELCDHIVALRRYALGLTLDVEDANDLVQGCLARAIEAADTWQPGSNLRAWLFRILRNLHVSNVRRRQLEKRALRPELRPESSPAVQPIRVELQETLSALARLPQPQREAVVLVALEELSYAEVAERLGVPIGTVMSRLARGREALRELLKGNDRPNVRLVKG